MSRPHTAALPHRKPMQIVLDSDNGSLVTLCNDGTIWTITMGLPEAGWEQLPAIPQVDVCAVIPEPTLLEPDASTCPVRCIGVLRRKDAPEPYAYCLIDAAGNRRDVPPEYLTIRHELISLFGGTDAWLRANFPKKVTVTISRQGSPYIDEATLDFRIDAVAQWLMAECLKTAPVSMQKAGEP